MKRAIDVTMSLIAVALLLPVSAFIAMADWMGGRGPVGRIAAPSQPRFRNVAEMYPPDCEFYENVLFSAKAAIDFEYYRNAEFVSDHDWVFKSSIAIFWACGGRTDALSRLGKTLASGK